MSYVYVITDGTYIKIGKANNPKVRVKQLQTGNPNKLTLLHSKKHVKAIALEKHLHTVFHHKKVNGEWFDVSINDIEKEIAKYEKESSVLPKDLMLQITNATILTSLAKKYPSKYHNRLLHEFMATGTVSEKDRKYLAKLAEVKDN